MHDFCDKTKRNVVIERKEEQIGPIFYTFL